MEEDPAVGAPAPPQPTERLRSWRGVAVVCVVFLLTMLVVPVLAPVSISDDWIWTRSVEILLRDGRFHVDDIAAPTLLFQTVWGAGFAALFGATFAVLRFSTIVIVLLSGLALNGLCREMDISPGRSALAVAVYLFHPLGYGTTFTFMTDPHFVALLVIASFFYVRGLRMDAPSWPLVLAGSVVASMALLVRQQGVLIPMAVATYLVATRRLRVDGLSARLMGLVAGVPLVTFVGYQLWITLVNGVPRGQNLDHIKRAGLSGNLRVGTAAAFVAVMYIGFFVLPVAVAAAARLPGLIRSMPGRRRMLAGGWLLLVALGVTVFAVRDRPMPYASLFVDPAGIGPKELVGGRSPLLGMEALVVFTAVTAAATVLFGLLLSRPSLAAWRGPAGLVLALLVWQLLGTLPPAGAKEIGGFRIITFDRYLLPLLPLAVCLALWALRDVRLPTAPAWMATGLLALFSVLGTRDHIVWQSAIWDMARDANCMGVPNDRLDAGHAWSGYYMSDGSFEPPAEARTPRPRPFWMEQLAPLNDSGYLVSTAEVPGRVTMSRREYSQWLQPHPAYLYLSRRPDVTSAALDPSQGGEASEVCRSTPGRLRVAKSDPVIRQRR